MHQIDLNDKQFIEERHGKITGWIPGAIDNKTGKINPQTTKAYMGNGCFVSVFHVKPVYYETAAGHWRPLSEITTHHGNHKIILNENWWKVHPRYLAWLDKRCKLIGGELLIPSTFKSYPTPYEGIVRSIHESLVPVKAGLTTTTVYPDPNVETTTVDGRLKLGSRSDDWVTIRAVSTATNAVDDGASGEMAETYATGSSNLWNELCRAAFLFDTSAIGDTDSIDSGTFSIYVISKGDISGALDVSLVDKTTASNTALATSDFDRSTKYGTTEYATALAIASISTSAYNDWTLNASGLSAISKTGVSKFGVLLKEDLDNTAPTWGAGVYGHITGYYADQTGTANDPKLVVNHTASGGGVATGLFLSSLGVG